MHGDNASDCPCVDQPGTNQARIEGGARPARGPREKKKKRKKRERGKGEEGRKEARRKRYIQ